MGIKAFRFDPLAADAFVRLGYRLYEGDANWIPPREKELYTQLSPHFPFYRKPGNAHRNFLARAGGREVGRVSAMINRDLRDQDGTAVGAIGFFECVDDFGVANDLFDAAVQWLHGDQEVRRIWGPMNFDIWHGYRLMTRGFERKLFLGEPYNKPYYPDFFERYGFVARHHWHSAEISGRAALEKIIAPSEPRYHNLVNQGYRFQTFASGRFEDNLRKLHSVLTSSFCELLGFTPISVEDFESLFVASRHAIHPGLLTLVYSGDDRLMGFAGAFFDISEAIRAARGRDGLSSKLRYLATRRSNERVLFYLCGSVTDETTKRTDFGRAVFFHTVRQILDEGFRTVLVALMSRGSAMTRLAGENIAAAQRQYTLYELNPCPIISA